MYAPHKFSPRTHRPHEFWLFSLLLALLFLPPKISAEPANAPNQEQEVKGNPRVLVLHSYHVGFTWSDNVTKGIRSIFGEEAPDVELLFEYIPFLSQRR